MNPIQHKAGRIGILAAAAIGLAGCQTQVEYVPVTPAPPPPAVVYVPPPQPPPVVLEEPAPAPPPQAPPTIVIERADDFYAPLQPYGRWVVVAGIGQCWTPTQVGRDWRPYTQGHWELTDAGWYWVSDEPWGWATCHYGRWDWRADTGWYWAPDTQWAPAWVSWRNGGGYVGWAPLPPAAVYREDVGIRFDVNLIPARSYCFVPEQHFTEPVRPTTVIVNNITIVNKTVNITNIRVVNKTIINEGPATQRIEQATGKPVRAVRAVELRQQVETRVAVKPKPVERQKVGEHPENHAGTPGNPPGEKPRPVEKPVVVEHREGEVKEPKPVTHEEAPIHRPPPRPVEKPVMVTHPEKPVETAKPTVEHREVAPVNGTEKPKAPIEERPVGQHPPTGVEHATEHSQHPETAAKPGEKENPQKAPPKKAPVRKPGGTNAPAEHREPEPRTNQQQ